MTINQYNTFAEEKRTFILERAGTLVASSYNKYYEFKLYQVNSFYVEVISKTDGTYCGTRAFTAMSQLDRYLSTIDISSIWI